MLNDIMEEAIRRYDKANEISDYISDAWVHVYVEKWHFHQLVYEWRHNPHENSIRIGRVIIIPCQGIKDGNPIYEVRGIDYPQSGYVIDGPHAGQVYRADMNILQLHKLKDVLRVPEDSRYKALDVTQDTYRYERVNYRDGKYRWKLSE